MMSIFTYIDDMFDTIDCKNENMDQSTDYSFDEIKTEWAEISRGAQITKFGDTVCDDARRMSRETIQKTVDGVILSVPRAFDYAHRIELFQSTSEREKTAMVTQWLTDEHPDTIRRLKKSSRRYEHNLFISQIMSEISLHDEILYIYRLFWTNGGRLTIDYFLRYIARNVQNWFLVIIIKQSINIKIY